MIIPTIRHRIVINISYIYIFRRGMLGDVNENMHICRIDCYLSASL